MSAWRKALPVGLVVAFVALATACGFGSKPPKAALTTSSTTATPRQPVAPPPSPQKPAFDEKEMVRPITSFQGYDVPDYTKLPNCLDVFARCAVVEWENLTTQQYKTALTAEARGLCCVKLKVVDVDATYDLVECELLTDAGNSGVAELKKVGDLNGYTKHLKEKFRLQGLKKKGLKADKVSKGDVLVLVGLGDVGDASSWGAADPTFGLPKSDERYVMLRAFGKENAYRKTNYEFAFMVRNWYIAKQ